MKSFIALWKSAQCCQFFGATLLYNGQCSFNYRPLEGYMAMQYSTVYFCALLTEFSLSTERKLSTLQHPKIEHTYLSNSNVGVSKSGDWPMSFLLTWLTSANNMKHLMIQSVQDFDTSYYLLYQLGTGSKQKTIL